MPTDSRSGSSGGSEPAPGSRPSEAQDPGPRIRPAAAVVLGLEALMLAVGATFTLVLVSSGALRGQFGVGLGAFLLLFALGAGLAARSILVRGRFGLGYGITWQLFQALIGASMLRGGLHLPGALALLLAIGGFVLLTRLVRSTPLPRREG